jgi:DNA-binding NarL/FixJ family response regulator
MIRTVLIDDHHLILEGLRRLLADSGKFEVVGLFARGVTFLEAFAQLKPQVIVVDINLPDIDGLELVRRIRATDKVVKILVLSMHDEPIFKSEAQNAGANGFVSKAQDLSLLTELLLELMEKPHGFAYSARRTSSGEGIHLSSQELAILNRVTEGQTTAEIGKAMGISPLTVKTHRKNLMRKFGVANAAELVRLAYQRGVI